MAPEALFFQNLLSFFFRALSKQLLNLRNFRKSKASNANPPQCKLQRYPSLVHPSGLGDSTLILDVEGALLKSPSLYPYFMLVAFEAGSLIRALVLFFLYPFICILSEEIGVKIMVMVCFLGIKKESFRAGRAVLPKFFLEDVGLEGFEVVRRCGRKVAVSKLPQVMVESFLREYLEIDCVVGRRLKVFCGFFVGLMEDRKTNIAVEEKEITLDDGDDVIGVCGIDRSLNHHLFPHCKEIYLVTEAEKSKWHSLPRDKYPKPLVFHDGRLALRPTPATTLASLMWAPFGVFLAIARASVAILLPRKVALPILAFSGLRARAQRPQRTINAFNNQKNEKPSKQKGHLYVCNHRTLLDPLYISFALDKPVTAVTYSLSKVSEILAPIKTVRLKRDRDQDAEMMEDLLDRGDVVVCPEGTTCREPYLLRFSPLFSEISEALVPVALDSHECWFHGTTASGLKCFDPLFFLMNPCPTYKVQLLPVVRGLSTCRDDGKSRFQVANRVQREIGDALGFECTGLTRRDKYLTLAGNEGKVTAS